MSEINYSIILQKIIHFCSHLLESINSIDIDFSHQFQVHSNEFVNHLLPYLPQVLIESLRDVIVLTVQWTPTLLKDVCCIISTIFSPTVIAKQIAFTGVIQTTLLTSHLIRELLDYIKSIIFTKVSLNFMYYIG